MVKIIPVVGLKTMFYVNQVLTVKFYYQIGRIGKKLLINLLKTKILTSVAPLLILLTSNPLVNPMT